MNLNYVRKYMGQVMALKDLANKWTLPDRSLERKTLTLRLSYDQYARLLALKETFNRPLNDILNTLIEGGIDEIIASPDIAPEISATFQANYARFLKEDFSEQLGDNEVIVGKNKQEQFRDWLIKKGNKGAAQSYPGAIKRISTHYSENTGRTIDVYSLKDIEQIKEIADKYKQGHIYSDYGYKHNGLYRCAIAKYLEFVQNLNVMEG